MKRFLFSALAALLAFLPGRAYAQTGDDFGFGGSSREESGSFGFDDGPSFTVSPAPGLSGVKISGEVSAELLGFTGDFDSWESAKAAELGDVLSGALNFSASGSAGDAVINLNLAPTASLFAIDEAYARVYFGPVSVAGGLRKLTWGRADSFGPLDVINPLDYTDLTKITDPMSVKLARPMAHISWGIGNFSKLEGVFIPGFQGHRFDLDGRWAPSQIAGLTPFSLAAGLKTNLSQNPDIPPTMLPIFADALDKWATDTAQDWNSYWSDNASLQYAQAGLRFATVMGSSDFGIQYYYGRLSRPAMNVSFDGLVDAAGLYTDKIHISMDYNSYHQIGVDFARVIADFNTRAEAAVNITEDLEGDRADIYNPSAAWSLGFDRDIVAGINVNLQAVETIRLFHDQIGKNPVAVDTEDGKDITSTRLTLILSKKFFRDKLELKTVGLWDIEETGFLIMPSIVYSNNDVTVELKYGFFGGEKDGELGQYRDNHFVKTALTYSF
ncbi:MAG: hypothetical protein LBK63_12855 [Treponema sp.]|jgi:hypothetical protein|nr:hypothetical protein [Treponema sp.]